MSLQGHLRYNADPLAVSLQGMTEQFYLLNFYADNIAYSDTPGYQRKTPVITTFAEHLGYRGIDTATNTSVGRIYNTGRPLDVALNTEGYFQKLQADGRVELTRDGRFRLDKTGRLLSDDMLPILSRQGTPIQLPYIPPDLQHVKIRPNGSLELFDPKTGEVTPVARIGVVSQNGKAPQDVDMRQKHVENSNVFLHEEFVAMVGPRRNFQANRQIFLSQSQALNRLIQELGRAQ